MNATSARAGLLLPILAGLAGAGASASTLDEKSCRLEHPSLPAAFARCATLVVPEDYASPDGPTLDLFVARVPARTATPTADPLLLVNGGPGGSTVDLYLQQRAAFAPVLLDRDIVLLDQRGTGRSLAGLTCDVPDDLELETATAEELKAAVGGCIAEFPSDPRQFTTSVAVRDLERLREALAAETIDLYGVSYGTRVVQHYLRRYPGRVRAAILDGVVPAELVLGPAIARDAQRALDEIFARCREDADCADRFADVETEFDELRQRFDGDSIELVISDPSAGEPESFMLDETHLQAVVRLMSYSDLTAALLPLIIDEAYKGNYEPLASQANLQIESVAESIGFAMHNSVVCTEDAPFFDRAPGRGGASNGTPDDRGTRDADPYLGTTIIDGLRAICELWPAGEIDADFKEPVVSDRPVLVLSGSNDPVTPAEYGTRVIAAGLRNAAHLIGPGKGHGIAGVGCVPELLREFLADPVPQDLDAECLARERAAPFFLSFQGPAP